MRNWDTADETGVCTSEQDWTDVQKVCRQLGITCRMVDYTKEYWVRVFCRMVDDYADGITPNPDILCNQAIKFGAFLDRNLPGENDSRWIATGHYAQIERTPDGKVKLLRGADSKKDQSYYLSTVPEERLRRVIFPIGHLEKRHVKAVASATKLITADKRESMGICFVGKKGRKFADFLEQYIEGKPGDIKTIDGQVIGKHRGLFEYTIGQCSRTSHGLDRWFVLKKDAEANALIVVPGSTNPLLYSNALFARDWVWSWGNPPAGIKEGINLTGQVRYGQEAARCKVRLRRDGGILVEFAEPLRAISPGQNVVVWDGNWCLGSGIIELAFSTDR